LYLKNDYAKAYAKRGEINATLDNHVEALSDYQYAHELDPSKTDFTQYNSLYRYP
jgi:hypothetical protein